MARLYSKHKGKSGSKRPPWTETPKWVTYTPDQIEELVVQKAREGHSSAMIGLILRDQYGIPNVKKIVGRSISDIMKEHGLYPEIPEDLANLIRKALRIRKHMEKNHKDYHNKRALQLTESKVRRLARYYVKKKVLPPNFRYRPDEAVRYLR